MNTPHATPSPQPKPQSGRPRVLSLNRRGFLLSAAGVALSGLGLAGYTWGIEPEWVEIVRRDLPFPRLEPAHEGWTVAQISDLHMGLRVSDAYLLRTFERVQALNPDCVVITGDFVSRHPDSLAQVERLAPKLPHGRQATLAVLGNHDYGRAWSEPLFATQLTRMLDRAGVRVLRNRTIPLAGVQWVGLDDLWGPMFSPATALARVDPAKPAVVLCHNPDGADHPLLQSFRGWILSGHTHGGQVRPPFLPPPSCRCGTDATPPEKSTSAPGAGSTSIGGWATW